MILTSVLATLSLAAPQNVVFLVGEGHHGSGTTIPAFAAELEQRLGIETHVAHSIDRRMPDLERLAGADLLVLFLRARLAEPAELAVLDAWLDSGKPAIALRTTSHAFEGVPEWFPEHFGGHYAGYAPDTDGTRVIQDAGAPVFHPILGMVPRVLELEAGGTYFASPLAEGATVMLFGRSADLPAQPVAWTFEPRPGVRRFYTSLGTREDFADAGFRELLENAIQWCLPPHPFLGGERLEKPSPPPARDIPAGATVLFSGKDLAAWRHWDPSLEPRAIEIPAHVAATPRSGETDAPRWPVEDGALVARPGFGDVVTRDAFGDVHLHVDFMLPSEPAWVPDEFRGNSGVFVAGRWEVAIADSRGAAPGPGSCGAITGYGPPLVDAAKGPGEWQTLDITYSQRSGAPARVTVRLNDVLVQDRVELDEPSPGGSLTSVPGSRALGAARFATEVEDSRVCDFGARSWAVSARFKTKAGGTLVSKCPLEGDWVPDAKALFLRGGRLVYDIGWIGALTSKRAWNDGEWHTLVVTSHDGLARMFVDGELEGEKEDFAAADGEDFVLKIGAANDNFGGTYEGALEAVHFFDREVKKAEAHRLSGGDGPGAFDARWSWVPGSDVERGGIGPDDPLVAPFRLQADASRVRFANIWVKPLGPVDHAGLVASLDEDARARGEKIYGGLCVQCHGSDGTKTLNPNARPFALGELENGADPFSLFGTITNGFRDMPSHDLLRPDQRYDVVHYLRESFLRERNASQYFRVTDSYLNALPKGLVRRPPPRDPGPMRDFGPALASQLGNDVGTCLSVRLDDETTIAYDLQTMESPGAWTGGFLDLSKTQHYQQRGEGKAQVGGELLPGLEGWGWGHGGTLDWDRSRRPERGLLPREWLDYHGHYVHGDEVVLAYAIDGREVLEMPGLDRTTGLPIVTHRLWVAPSDTELVLSVTGAPEGDGEVLALSDLHAEAPGQRAVRVQVIGRGAYAEFHGDVRFSRAALLDGPGEIEWSGTDRAVLRIPASTVPLEYWILRASSSSSAESRAFGLAVDNRRAEPPPPSARTYVQGGPARYPEELVSAGKLGKGQYEVAQGYALDTLALPEANPWNAWIRTSALDFFPDGRAAVTTLGGDVWIVSGIDADLDELRWRRFATGLFEPLGVRVVDDVVYVTCRDRITRLHDLNGDGEADFYESFFADPDVSTNFHAFNFDLQTDPAGNFYYAKSGQYTDYALPGAILRVAPDGRSHDVYATGLRTPNGMGMSPGGRPLVSDNQGNWIPASKISLTREGGFYGVFKSINTSAPGKQTRDDFDAPVLWMPQSFDSSSGGQLFVDDERWGPLSGRYVHTSFGKGWLYPMWVEDVSGVEQAGAWRLPFQFAAGLQRARVNPADGQVYGVGLSGWQGPAGGDDGCFQRVRYTGGPGLLLVETRTLADGFELVFAGELDSDAAHDTSRYSVRRWDYLWARSYGSQHYSVARPGEVGEDDVPVLAAEVGSDGRTLTLRIGPNARADQVELTIDVPGAGGTAFQRKVYLTVNAVPPR